MDIGIDDYAAQVPATNHHDDQIDGPDVRDKDVVDGVTWQARTVSVEPVLFIYLLASGFVWPAVSALTYKKVCMLSYDEFTCDNLHNVSNRDIEDVVQGQTSHWFLWQNYVFEMPAVLLSIGYGSLSDHVSRRLTIAVPLVGQLLGLLNYTLMSFFKDSHVGYILVGSALSGLSGGWITLFMACFSYLGEACTPKDRTKRVLIAEGVAGLSMGISLFLSGIVLDNTSYIFVFSLSAGISLLGIIYVVTFIREPPKKVLAAEQGKTSCSLFLHRMKDSVLTVFRKRENNGRARILVSIMIVFSSMVSGEAIYTVGFLFLKRRPLSWTQSTYGVFVALRQLVPSLVLLCIVPLLRTRLKLRDTTLMLVGLTSGCLAEFWFSFCTRSWMVFLMPFIGSFKGAGTVVRSLLSQFVQPHELGKMFAVLGALQTLSGMVGTTLFNILYPHTLRFWPGFCFTLGTMLAVIPASLIWWLHRDMGRGPLFRRLSETELDKVVDNDDRDPLLLAVDEEEINEEDGFPNGVSKETVIA